MEEDTLSWKDRCNRYFSSLSDTSKDKGQEKDQQIEINKSDEKHLEHEHTEWKELGDVKKKVSRGKFDRYVRKILNMLDLHGARFAGKSRNSAELVLWVIITILAMAVLFGLVFFMVKEFRKSKETFTVSSVSSLQKDVASMDKVVVKFCNMNLLRNSYIAGSRFTYLRQLEENTPVPYSISPTLSSLHDIIVSNAKLKAVLTSNPDINLNAIVEKLTGDLDVHEILVNSNVSLDYRLGVKGHWDLVRGRIYPLRSEIERLGHQVDDMLVECRVEDRNCKNSEIQPAPDTKYGNCFSIVTEDNVSKMHVVLDAQPGEYLHAVSPAVGFLVSVQSPSHDVGKFILAGASRQTQIKITRERVVLRESPCSHSSQPNKCFEDCYDDSRMRICGCRENTEDETQACDRDGIQQYVCLKTVHLLYSTGVLKCDCLESCRDVTFMTVSSDIEWPNAHNMHRIQTTLEQKGKQMNETMIRNGVLKVSVDLRPEVREVVEQNHEKSVLELLAHIGGLSALVLGLSAVALIELVWTLIRISIDFVRYLCRRSTTDGSMHRLTDSEITSITWAIYRQKRQMEEKKKESEKANQRKQQSTIGGNVQNRLYRRSSTSSRNPDDHDQFELRNPSKDYGSMEHKPTGMNNNVKMDRNGYRKYNHLNNGRLNSISEETQYKNSKNGHSGSANGILERSHHGSNGHGSYMGSESDSRYRHMYSQRLPYIQPVPVEGVRLYGGTAAYFHTNTEPTYL